MKTKTNIFITIILMAFTFTVNAIENFNFSTEQNDKIEKLASLAEIDPNDDSLNKIISYIHKNWDLLMVQNKQNHNTFHLITFGPSFITVHPDAQEVCIFLDNHAQVLGRGAFKRAVKGLTYTREKEVAVAFPIDSIIDLHFNNMKLIKRNPQSLLQSSYEIEWNSYDYSNFNSDIEWNDPWNTCIFCLDNAFDSLDSDYNWMDSYYDSDEFKLTLDEREQLNEIKLLTKVQNCKGVVKLFFITFPQDNTKFLSPVFVQQYYNSGALSHSIQEMGVRAILLTYHDTLMGLSDIHDQDIIHRDLHLGNILGHKNVLTQEIEEVVIADFGISLELIPFNLVNIYKKKQDTEMLLSYIHLATLNNKLFFVNYKNGVKLQKLLESLNELSHKMTTRELYTHYVTRLEGLLSEEDFAFVTKNSLQTRNLSYTNGNTIIWD